VPLLKGEPEFCHSVGYRKSRLSDEKFDDMFRCSNTMQMDIMAIECTALESNVSLYKA